MRKKALCAILSVAMVASMFVACGSDDKKDGDKTTPAGGNTPAGGDTTPAGNNDTTPAPETNWDVTDGGKVLNIWVWNEEFRNRITDHYPGYEKVSDDGLEGKIGDVKVVWTVNTNEGNVYQDKLDAKIGGGKNTSETDKDKRVDIFLVEADYALKYVDKDVSAPVSAFGITDADVASQYEYTKQIVTDSKGQLKGLSWQGCPGIMFYNRAAAKDVLGSDDADTVQAAVKDWAAFNDLAAKADEKGYDICATVNDTYRVYSNNVSKPWVDASTKKLQLDDNLKAWVDASKVLVDKGYATTDGIWSDGWKRGFFPDGKVFAYFGPAWLVNFCMSEKEAGSIANQGGWGACVGPQSFFWGGTWIVGANGSDNKELVKDIMLKMTTDEKILKEIVEKDDDFTNNPTVMEAMAKDTSYKSAVLGGINPLNLYCEGVKKIDLSNLSAWDQGCNEEFQGAMADYFNGKSSYEDALDAFATAVKEKYPELDVSDLQK